MFKKIYFKNGKKYAIGKITENSIVLGVGKIAVEDGNLEQLFILIITQELLSSSTCYLKT